MEPVSTTIAIKTAVSAAVKSKVVQAFSEGVRGIFGETATDRSRRESAEAALARALEGDLSAVEWLLVRAGINPANASASPAPKSARFVFRKALRAYYTATGQLPEPSIRYKIWARDADIPVALRTGAVPVMAPATSSGGLVPSPSVPGAPMQAGIGNASPIIAIVALAGIALAMARRK